MIELISVAKTFGVRPSSLLYGISSYEAYCFDTACLVYIVEMDKGKKPIRNMGDALTWL
jgi:hypothetical protein